MNLHIFVHIGRGRKKMLISAYNRCITRFNRDKSPEKAATPLEIGVNSSNRNMFGFKIVWFNSYFWEHMELISHIVKIKDTDILYESVCIFNKCSEQFLCLVTDAPSCFLDECLIIVTFHQYVFFAGSSFHMESL